MIISIDHTIYVVDEEYQVVVDIANKNFKKGNNRRRNVKAELINK